MKWSINSADGQTVSLGRHSAGSWWGEGILLRGVPRKAQLVALRQSRVAMLAYQTFASLRETEPSFDRFLLRQINNRMFWLMDNLAAMRFLDAEHQVARALVGLIHPLLNPRGERYLQISQEEVAYLAIVSRQKCNVVLMDLKKKGWIELEYEGLTIIDLHALQTQSKALW